MRPGLLRCVFDSGDMISGCSQMNIGEVAWHSRKWPTSLSSRRVVVRGSVHWTSNFLVSSWRNLFVSGEARSVGILTFMASSSPSIRLTRRNGGVKSTMRSSYSSDGLYFTMYDPWIDITMPEIICSVTFIRSS